jgi:hypothetical protein
MKSFISCFLIFVFYFSSFRSAWGDDFIPYDYGSSPIYELTDSNISLDLLNANIINQDSYFSTNSCSAINPNKNLIFLNSKISFSYCYPTWIVLSFDVPSDWEPGTSMFIDLNWCSLDNAILGSSLYKSTTIWKIFYKSFGVGDKLISSFDISSPSTKDQAVNNLVESLKTFKSASFSTETPSNPNILVSTGKNLIIKAEDINLNKQILLVIYREVQKQEDKFYPAINLQSAKIIYTKKQLK